MPRARLIERHDRCAQIERHIHTETSRRLRQLDVRCEAGQTVVRGTAPSYYVRQLAEKAALEVVAPDELELAISVELFSPTEYAPLAPLAERRQPALAAS